MKDTPRWPQGTHSASFKSEVRAACAQGGASVARVAVAHGVIANLVHRCLREAADRGLGRLGAGELADFVPMAMVAAPVVAAAEYIRIELRRGAWSVSIACPISAVNACAGSLRGGQRVAAVMSLVQSAKLNGHVPQADLRDVLARIPTQPASRIEELLPQRWLPT